MAKNVNKTLSITPVNTTSHLLNTGGRTCKQDKSWEKLPEMTIPGRPAEKPLSYGKGKK